MVNERRIPANTWRRDSDTYDSRGGPSPRYPRDSSRERDYDRNYERDRSRDRGRERDADMRGVDGRDRGWDQPFCRPTSRNFSSPAHRDPERRPSDIVTKIMPNSIVEQKSHIGGPVPRGPKAGAQRSPDPLRPIQSPHNSEPRTPSTLGGLRSPNKALVKPADTKSRDYASSLLTALLRKSRDVGEHEQVKKSLDLLDKRREEQMRALSKKTDFPSLPELHRPKSETEIRQREVAEENVAKTTADLVSSSKNFMAHVYSWKPPVAVLESDVQSLRARQDNMDAKLGGFSMQTLEDENARLRKQVHHLAELVESLEKRVGDMSEKMYSVNDTSTELVSDVERLSTRSKIHSSMIGAIETKANDHEKSIAKLKAVDFEAINQYMSTEKQHQLEKQSKQEVEIAKLKTQMLAVQNGLRVATPTQTAERQPQGQQKDVHNAVTTSATVPTPAPAAVASNQETPTNSTPPTTTPIVFPGDDFTSLRIEISMLNERIVPLEKLPEKLDELEKTQTQQLKTAAAQGSLEKNKLREDVRVELNNGFAAMAEQFGDLVDKESKERSADSARLAELEKTIQDLKGRSGSAPVAASTQDAPPAANIDTAMAEAILEPFLSPVPEPVQPAGPAGSVEPIEPLSTLPSATAQTLKTGLAVAPAQVAVGPDVQDLEKEMHLLQRRMQYSEDEVRSVRVEFDGQCATLRMMVSTLDSQFNNLTTKHLYNSIIGHLEKMYPSPRQMQEDVKKIGADVNQLKQANRSTNETIQKIESIIDVQTGQKRSLAGGGSNGGPPGESPSAVKRQRLGGAIPGGAATTNGTAINSTSSSANGFVNGNAAATSATNP